MCQCPGLVRLGLPWGVQLVEDDVLLGLPHVLPLRSRLPRCCDFLVAEPVFENRSQRAVGGDCGEPVLLQEFSNRDRINRPGTVGREVLRVGEHVRDLDLVEAVAGDVLEGRLQRRKGEGQRGAGGDAGHGVFSVSIVLVIRPLQPGWSLCRFRGVEP